MTIARLSSKFLTTALLASMLCAAQAKTLQVYILTGQSNSLGAVKGSPASASLLSQYATSGDGSPLFWQRNIASNAPAGESTSWGVTAPNVPAYSGNLCMGPEYGFAYMMQKKGWNVNENSDVAIIKASRDGGGNSNWVKGSGAMYDSVMTAVKNALSAVNPNEYDSVEIVGLMYLQGESNNNNDETTQAAARFKDLVNNLKADIAALDNLPVTVDTSGMTSILGEIATWNGTDNNATRNNQYALSQTAADQTGIGPVGWVATRDLGKITSGDSMGVHYDGKAQITIGARYAYEAAKQAGYDVGNTRSGNYDLALDQKKAWMNEKLTVDGTGKVFTTDSVAVWDVASSAKDNIISASTGVTLVLPGIRVEDPYLDTIVIQGKAAGSNPSLADTHLKIGSDGISIAAGKNLTLKSAVEINGNQSWNIAGGSSLKIVGADTTGNNVLSFITGSGNISVANSTYAADPAKIAKVLIDVYINSGVAAFQGDWTIGQGVELTINGNAANTGAGKGWGTGTVTLQGATVLASWEQFNNTWNNTFILADNTSSAIGSSTNSSARTLSMGGQITGGGELRKITDNTLILSGNNNYSGGTVIEAGKIQITHNNALGTGDVTVKTGGTLDLNSRSIDNQIVMQGGSLTNLGNQNLLVKIDKSTSFAASFSLKDGSSVSADAQLTFAQTLTTLGNFTVTLSTFNDTAASGMAALIANGGTLNLQTYGLCLNMNYDISALQDGAMLSFNLIDNNGGVISGLNGIDDLSLSSSSMAHWTIENYDTSSGTVSLQWHANIVPEPSVAGLSLIGAALLLIRRRKSAN